MRYGSVVQATSTAVLYSWLVRAPSAPVSLCEGSIHQVALDWNATLSATANTGWRIHVTDNLPPLRRRKTHLCCSHAVFWAQTETWSTLQPDAGSCVVAGCCLAAADTP